VKPQKKKTVGISLPVVKEETCNTELASLSILAQIDEELCQDRLDLVEMPQLHLERLEQHLGQLLRLIEAQGPAGKKALEEFKRAHPNLAQVVETASRRVPSQ